MPVLNAREHEFPWIQIKVSDQGLGQDKYRSAEVAGLDIWSAVCLCVGEWGFRGMCVLLFRVEITLEPPRVHSR